MAHVSVLIVEDEAIVAANLAGKMAMLGYRVVGEVCTGEEALQVAQKDCPDVALLDLRLAGSMDGVETAKHLKALCDTPIIFITAHSDKESVLRASAAGPAAYVLKPFDERDLATQIEFAIYRHKAEKTLRENELRMRLAQEAARWGVFEYNYKTGQNYWSPELEALYGLPQGSFEGTYEAWSKRIHPSDLPTIERGMAEAKSTGQYSQDFRIVWGDGSIHWLFARAKVFYDANGQPERMVGVNVDITERKVAETALLESEARFRTLADSAPVLIWMNGLQGCEFVNHAYLDFLGVDRQVDVANYDWAKFVHETDRDSYVTEYLTAVAKQEVFDARFRFRRADGEYRWMHSIGRPRFGSSGELLGYVGASFDITHLLEAQDCAFESPRPN